MELCTGPISIDEMDDEVAEIARLLTASGFHTALVTYGFAHAHSGDPEADNFPVAMTLLPEFLEQREEEGMFRMGYDDLFFKIDDSAIAFLLCEMADIHCYTDDVKLFQIFSQRWAELYSSAYEADRAAPARWRPLAGGEWRLYGG